jgi:phytochrome B
LYLSGEEEQNVEIQLRTFGLQKGKGAVILIVNACSSRDVQENVVGVCFVGQDVTSQKQVHDKFTRIHGDYKSIVQNPNPLIPPRLKTPISTDQRWWCLILGSISFFHEQLT